MDEITKQDNRPAKGRGGKYNFPSSPAPADPGTVSSALSKVMRWYSIGKTRAADDDEIERRTAEYFQYCIDNDERPTVESYCLCLGYARNTVFKWECNDDRRGNIIKAAKEAMAALDAGMVLDGKLQAIPWIFRAKNYYGMKDQQEIVLEPKAGITDENPDAVAGKYGELPSE